MFQSIKPLFQAKPLVIVLTKSDLQKFTELPTEERQKIENLAREANAYLIQMSNITLDGIEDVKMKACDILLDHRMVQKGKDPKKQEAIMNRLHIAQPKKRDNYDRPSVVPKTVLDGLKKEGPTIKQLQEEYGGAGNFYIPPEEHFMLDKEEWRYDQFPEFYNGSNVLDFYDPDIERKLEALEREEDEILKMEADQNQMMDGVDSDEENSDGIDMKDLKASLAEVRSKKAIFKQRHKLKGKLVHREKKAKVEDVIDHFESIGVKVDKERLRSRSKTRRGINDLESAQEKKASAVLGSSDDEAEMPVDDKKLNDTEMETRGRKRRRERSVNPDDYMDVDDEEAAPGQKKRNLTPAQRTVSA